MLILEIAVGIVLGAFILALVPVVLELLAEGWSLFWEFVADALALVFVTIPKAIWKIGTVIWRIGANVRIRLRASGGAQR